MTYTGPIASTAPAIAKPSERRERGRKGLFIVVDGLDGIGKGVVERTLTEIEQKQGKATFDVIAFSRAHSKGLPNLVDFWNPPKIHYHTLITAEPTYTGVGHNIRNEMIARTDRSYSAESLIDAYSVDREIQMKKVVIPALETGLNVIQGRCVASTICYQGQKSGIKLEDLPGFAEKLMEKEGNRMQLTNYAPDLLIIPTVDDIQKVIDRIKARSVAGKDDKAIFDNLEFQGAIKPFYESSQLRELFEKAGTKVVYLDAGKTIDDTVEQTGKIYNEFIASIRRK